MKDCIIIKDITFWYNPDELKMGSEMQAYLANQNWQEESYSIYIDPSVGLVIY